MGRFICRAALILGLFAVAGPALAQSAPKQPNTCPNNPAGTVRIFETDNSFDADKAKLIDLSGAAKGSSSVCVLAFIDPADQSHSKKLAIRRVKWVFDTMIGQGVPRPLFTYEFRTAADSDKAVMRHVEIVLGR